MINEIFKGMLIGFAAIAPIGMQNLYVFNNALTNPLKRAWLFAAIIWVSDATFELAAFYGIGAVIASNETLKRTVMLIGGFVLMYIAWTILRGAKVAQFNTKQTDRPRQTIRSVIISAVLLVWANPQALVDGSLMLGALRSTLSAEAAVYFIIGVLIASLIWFFGITTFIGLLKEKLPAKFLLWVNIISGMIVFGYGAYLISHVLLMIFWH